MIISASRRTDIPAFYSSWFMNRIRAGSVKSVNPFNSRQVSQVSLQPEQVDVIVFWTRDPRPLLPYLPELDLRGFRYYFLMTLNAYPQLLEPGNPTAEEQVSAFRELSGRVGPEKVIWRYDPIVVSNVTPWEWHEQNFARLSQELQSYCRRVVISLVDEYRKTSFVRLESKNLQIWRKEAALPPHGERMFRYMAAVANATGFAITSCAEAIDLTPFGVQPGACIAAEYLLRTFGISTAGKDPGQRPGCVCLRSKDIGGYDTCPRGCVYCYASRCGTAEKNYLRHRPEADRLLNWLE